MVIVIAIGCERITLPLVPERTTGKVIVTVIVMVIVTVVSRRRRRRHRQRQRHRHGHCHNTLTQTRMNLQCFRDRLAIFSIMRSDAKNSSCSATPHAQESGTARLESKT